VSERPTLAHLIQTLDQAFPPAWTEPWDNVGLLVGNPSAPLTGVLISLDPTPDAIARAASAGANALVTHHPAYLEAPARLTGSSAVERLVAAALSSGVALIAAHTNLDRSPAGASALPALLDLEPGEPLECSLQPMSLVTVFCPPEVSDRVRSAMVAAGAGRVGAYDGCSFSSAGEGRFRVPADARPLIGEPGQTVYAEEFRLEMVCDPGMRSAVVGAARRAHPYEEPLIVVSTIEIARGLARMGRVSALEEPITLAHFAARAGDVFGCTPRVWGERDHAVARVATATGSAGGLLADAIAMGAHVLVAGEVRYHDALAALERGLAIIELGHDVSEWPLVPLLGKAVLDTPGLDPARVTVDEPSRAWWTP
jgi:dinuclear metal center YbgI/SA1388 family protein